MSQNILSSTSENRVQIGKRKQFLRFHLEPETNIMLPIEQVTEVLKISLTNIVPIPQMSTSIMGVYNWRGEILWTVDLGHLVGLNAWQEQRINPVNATVIILSYPNGSKTKGIHKKNLGLIINSVEDIEWCALDSIQSPPNKAIANTLAPFVTGYWLKPGGEMILVFDGNYLINSIN